MATVELQHLYARILFKLSFPSEVAYDGGCIENIAEEGMLFSSANQELSYNTHNYQYF